MLYVALLISLLLQVGGAPVKPTHILFNRAMETLKLTSTDKQVSEGYIRGLLMLLLHLNDAKQRSNAPFRGSLQDKMGPMKRQNENASESTAEDLNKIKPTRREGCRFLYWKTWTAC